MQTAETPWDNVACETVHYGAWDTGTRTIYATPIPLWEETVRSGHPLIGNVSSPTWTAFPETLPDVLPKGAREMGADQGGGGYAWVIFDDEDPAFRFALSL